MHQQNDPQGSPIWAIDLFERRLFRNGNSMAQCMECGQSFDESELAQMTGHLVRDHPQYAAKLLAKQLEFGGHCQSQHQQMKMGTATTKHKAESDQQYQLSSNLASSATPAADTDGGTARRSETTTPTVTIGTPLPPSSLTTPSPLMQVDGGTSPVMMKSNKEGSNKRLRNFDYRFSFSFFDGAFCCSVLPAGGHDAAGVHCYNMGRNNKNTNNNNTLTTTTFSPNHPSPGGGQPKQQTQRHQRQCPQQQHYANERTVLAFAAALPNIGDTDGNPVTAAAVARLGGLVSKEEEVVVGQQRSNGSTDKDGQLTISNDDDNPGTTVNRRPRRRCRSSHCDRMGKQWQWMCNMDNIDALSIKRFCQAHFLQRTGTRRTAIFFACQFSRRNKTSLNYLPCPYRVKYVVERRAIFVRETHTHALPTADEVQREEETIAAEENVAEVAWNNSNKRVNNTNSVQQKQQQQIKPQRQQAVALSPLTNLDNFLDGNGKTWEMVCTFDVGNCQTYHQQQQLREFCRKHGLFRQFMSRDANGTLLQYKLKCKEAVCAYRAVYVVERRAIFDRNLHNHPTGKWKALPKKQRAATTTQTTLRRTTKEVVSAPFANCGDYVNKFGKAWRWLANIDLGECETDAQQQQLRAFCQKHGLHRNSAVRNQESGALQTLLLYCKELSCKRFDCLYRAIYVVQRRAIFERGTHDHTTTPLPRYRRRRPLRKRKISSA